MSSFKKTALYLVGVIVLVAGMIVLFPEVGHKVSVLVKSAQDFAHNQHFISDVREELFSKPLRSSVDDAHAQLSRAGVIAITNEERSKEDLPVLKENATLNKAAEAKLKDMFDQQYFEHVSPQGNGPGFVVQQAGYSYILVGENLALGNFKNDAALVQAWMESPGHRANIMHPRFQEIGVAVGQGTFDGKKVWLAVQEFGTPASSCPSLDAHLKSTIDANKATLATLSSQIEKKKAYINTMHPSTYEEQQEYNRNVDEYNTLVAEYEVLSKKLMTEIDTYNKQVRAYNACIKG